MKYPEFLQKNGTIGYVAPSFGCAIEPYKSAFANALGKFKAMGYKADIGPNVYEESGIGISSTPRNCGEELNDSYCGNSFFIILNVHKGMSFANEIFTLKRILSTSYEQSNFFIVLNTLSILLIISVLLCFFFSFL